MVPEVFGRENEQSCVQFQPDSKELIRRSYHALLACPTQSIGAGSIRMPEELLRDYPLKIDGPVYHLGFHSEKSYGAASYLIVHPEGNIMVDSPRYSKPLAQQIEKLGGVKDMFFTHSDDVADHENFQKHFGCKRWIHRADAEGELDQMEKVFDQKARHLRKDVKILETPGHTDGSCCLLYKNYLFSGDHLAWSIRLGHLYAFYSYHKDWRQLTESMEKLFVEKFNWILPGHGRRFTGTDEQMQNEKQMCLDWMKAQP
jgi:glyoxylase-like metal-dependent hydrolase (beta-lactamase superfamily II)